MNSRKHPVAARILRRWRLLTGEKQVRDRDRRSVVACSGGADSMALAYALASVNTQISIAHVVHDLRDSAFTLRDRDVVESLAKQLGRPFLERHVKVAHLPGNPECNARDARYKALCEMAQQVDAGIVLTGHHADDQLETVLMRMMRGTGGRGLGGIAPIREIGAIRIVRPMLEITRSEIEDYCQDMGIEWVEDHTNADEGYLRNRIRHSVLPALREIEPEIALRVASLSKSCREMNQVLEHTVRASLVAKADREPHSWAWSRQELRIQPDAMLSELVFVFLNDVLSGIGADSITRQTIEGVVRAIKSDDTNPHEHRVGPMVIHVQARTVVISEVVSEPRPKDSSPAG